MHDKTDKKISDEEKLMKDSLDHDLEDNSVEIEPTQGDDNTLSDESEDMEETDEEGAVLSATDQLKKLRSKLKVAVEEKQQYLNGWQKDKAEFINVRKRDEDSRKEYMKYASQQIVEDLLPILDGFDMAMNNKEGWESVAKEWRVGVEGLYQQLLGVLARNEVVAIGAIGEPFDPNFHHSIGSMPITGDAKDHTIAQVLQKGYKMKDRVIRPALVKVFEA